MTPRTTRPRTLADSDKHWDIDEDGKIDPTEIALRREISELKNVNSKEATQRKMAWVALISLIGFPLLILGSSDRKSVV